MISLKIKNIKELMNELLTGTKFDFLCVSEIQLKTFCTYTINGHINTGFYSEEEIAALKDKTFTSWKKLKPVCYNLIKGQTAPEYLKITFLLPQENYSSVIEKSDATLNPDDIQGIYLHLVYEDNSVNVITSTSLNIFSLDKTLDKYWDTTITKYLDSSFDVEINQ